MSQDETTGPASMRWPGIRNKLLPVQAMRMAGWSWPSLTFRNWYEARAARRAAKPAEDEAR